MTAIALLGLRISVYTRIARLALEEKAVPYRFEEVDVFADGGPPADYLELNPFGTIPCLRHGDFTLYETAAISRYVDREFPGIRLQPTTPAELARMDQVIGVLDSYGYRPMIWDVYVQRVSLPAEGGKTDEARVAGALPVIRRVLQQLDHWRGQQPFLVGEALTLADLHFYPMLCYFAEVAEGRAMLAEFPRLQAWMDTMRRRRSVQATPYQAQEG